MSTRQVRRVSIFLMLVFATLALTKNAAAVVNRLAQMDPTVRATVPGTVHPLARPEFDQGAVGDGTALSMTMYFARSAAQQSALEALLAEQQDPSSPQYHQWLTPELFGKQFGLSAQELATARNWLQQQGFTVTKVADSANAISFTGTAGQVRSAMGTAIHQFEVDGKMHFANASAVMLPAAMAQMVSGVRGLDDFKPTPKYLRGSTANAASTGGAQALFTSGVSGNHYLAPGDVQTIYDVTPLYTGGYTGAGEVIGIAGQTDLVLSDIADFRADGGLPANVPQVVLIGQDPGISYSDLPEASLDIEWSGAMAYNATIVFLNSQDAFTSLMYGISNRITVNGKSTLIPILSISYGNCEAQTSQFTFSSMEAALQQAASQGQTVMAASGDTGAADCDYTPANAGTPVLTATQGLAVDYPASSSYVTGVGGTEFNEGSTAGATTYWNSNWPNNTNTDSPTYDLVSSAKSYIPEMAWDDTPTQSLSDYYDQGLLGGGGGASILVAKPSWQTGVTGIPADGHRDVPDIALNASPVHDSYLVCTEYQPTIGTGYPYYPSCTSTSFRSSYDGESLTVYGGTSLGAPIFSGMLALLEQKMGGSQQGPINPILYTMASNGTTYASAFHDITVGSNQMPCSGGTGCVSGLVGYKTTTGYDQATGLGSVDANNLAVSFTGGKPGTSVAITYLPNPPVIGQTVTITATVTQMSGVTTPTGTVTFSIDGTAGNPVTMSAGVATTTYSFATGGSHVVSAVYSGDSNYYTSSNTVTISNFVNAPASIATTTVLSSSSGSNTVPFYSTTAPTFTAVVSTASPGGNLSGTTVTFTVGSGSSAVSTKVATPSNCSTTSCTVTFQPANVTAATGFSLTSTPVSAHYDGNTNFQQSSSNALTLPMVVPSYTFTVPQPITVSAATLAAATTVTITLNAVNGFSDMVNLQLSSSTYPGCGYVTPSTVTTWSGTTATTVMTIGNCTNAELKQFSPFAHDHDGVQLAKNNMMARGAGAALAALCVAGCFARRRRMPRLLAVLAIVMLGGLLLGANGCGNGTSTLGSGLTPGTYAVTITGVDANNALVPQVSSTFNVIVQ